MLPACRQSLKALMGVSSGSRLVRKVLGRVGQLVSRIAAFRMPESYCESRHMFSEIGLVRNCTEAVSREHLVTGLGNSKTRNGLM